MTSSSPDFARGPLADTTPQTDFYRPIRCILGLPIDAATVNQAVTIIEQAASARRRILVSTPNLNFLVSCLADEPFRDSVIFSDLSIVDGQPLVWAGRLSGAAIPERVAGATVFERLRQKSAGSITVYFFGGPEGAAAQAMRNMNQTPSGLRCVGACSPGFGSVAELSSAQVIDDINGSGAQFLVVALSAQKGQAWILHNLARLKVPVISHLGAVVNLVAETISRAPPLVQRWHGEWLWRIKEEPLLWRRYFNDGTAFLQLIATRLLPCAACQCWARLDRRHQRPATLAMQRTLQASMLTFSGTWHEADLQPLRAAFTELAKLPGDIELDLKDVTFVDSATLGLFLLLYGHQRRQQHKLVFRHVSAGLRRLFALHCVGYLLQDAQPDGQTAAASTGLTKDERRDRVDKQ